MKANEWLALVTKHVDNPDEISDEDLATLRSNYVVWKSALELIRDNARNALVDGTRKALHHRSLPEAEFLELRNGQKPASLTEEEWAEIFSHRAAHAEFLNKIMAAQSAMKFYSAFDKEFQNQNNGDQPPEVVEIYWKKRAENLYGAISNHRLAHVMANKQPNGFDFLLWQEINEGEFHASQHIEMQKTGRLSFREV